MPAQPGNAILLQYRAQPPAAQPGAAVLLDSRPTAATRTARAGIVAPWAVAAPLAADVRGVMEPTTPRDVAVAAPWAVGQRSDSRTAAPWGVVTAADRAALAPWGAFGHRHAADLAAPWGIAATADRATRAPWGRYGAHPARLAVVPWGVARAADRAAVAPWGVYAALSLGLAVPLDSATPADRRWVIPWLRYARQLNPGWGVVIEPGGPPVDENGTVLVPNLRSYIVLNNVTLMRVSNALSLPALSLQISIDADSWGWGWSASMPASQLGNLERDAPGVLVELEAQVNGVIWRLLVERITRDRRFGQDRLSVSGRGIAAQLADPIYPAESRDNTAGALTAQQLADAALTYNGAPLGWTLDWQIADWLVPAGAWVHTGTPMDAVTRIASAAGGYVQADPATQTLHVLPRYPLLPWEWADATPDVILPSAATTREGIEYLDRPNYNTVYVSGGTVGGILGQVKIAGTAGDVPAEMVTDALITHVDPARGRGTAILGDTGRQQIMTLETPILADIGLYNVGTLLQWEEGAATRRGLVRSVSISAGMPRVRQTIEVETHA